MFFVILKLFNICFHNKYFQLQCLSFLPCMFSSVAVTLVSSSVVTPSKSK